MSNSSRWRRLMEWLRYRQDFNEDINLDILMKVVSDIKEGKEINVTELTPNKNRK